MAEAPPPGAPAAGLRAFGALSFAYFASIGLFNTYAPLWFQALGFSALAIGTIGAVQAWTRLVSPYAWSWLADHRGHRDRLLRTAAVCSVAAAALLPWQPPLAGLMVVVALLFLANGGIVPLSEASLVARLQTGQGVDSGRYGRVRMWGSIGFIVAVTGFGFLLERTGVGAFPWLVVGMFGLLAVAAWQVHSGEVAPAAATGGAGAMATLRRAPVLWFFASVFFTVLGHTALYLFFSLYLVSHGHAESVVGLLWAVGVAVEVAFFWYQGHWFGRWRPETWLALAAGVAAVRFAIVAWMGQHLAVLVVTQLLHAITFAGHHAACVALLDRHFPGRLRARGQALYTMLGYGASGVVGGLAGGALVQALGYTAVFWAACACGLAGLACALRCAAPVRAPEGARAA